MLANIVTDTGSYLEKKTVKASSVHIFTRGLLTLKAEFRIQEGKLEAENQNA